MLLVQAVRRVDLANVVLRPVLPALLGVSAGMACLGALANAAGGLVACEMRGPVKDDIKLHLFRTPDGWWRCWARAGALVELGAEHTSPHMATGDALALLLRHFDQTPSSGAV